MCVSAHIPSNNEGSHVPESQEGRVKRLITEEIKMPKTIKQC